MANKARQQARQYAAVMSNKNTVKIAEPRKTKVGKKMTAAQLRAAFSDFLESPSHARSLIHYGARPRFVQVGRV